VFELKSDMKCYLLHLDCDLKQLQYGYILDFTICKYFGGSIESKKMVY